jgi:hypothetical protein
MLLVLITIPLTNVLNIIATVILLVVTSIFSKKEDVKITLLILIPISLYFLMSLSFFWSINKGETSIALIKELPILIIPLVFLYLKEFSKQQKQRIIAYYSHFIIILAIYYMIRAIIRYSLIHDARVFFYHGEENQDYGLVPKLLNAIHVSVFTAIAFFYFVTKEVKSKADTIYSGLLLLFILLLSSKNMILVIMILILLYVFFFSKIAHKMRLRNIIVFGILLIILFSVGKIKQRFQVEVKTNSEKSIIPSVLENISDGVHYVSIKRSLEK